jgi:putative phosphoesterase
MKAGIISDTHDNLEAARNAARLFLREGVEVIFHLGDVVSPIAISPFERKDVRLVAAFGNNDTDRDGLQLASKRAFGRGPRIVEAGGRKILMGHSFDELQKELAGARGRFDLVLFGHTHRPLVMRVGRALVLNPGEGGGHVSGRATCAVVDLETMEARILDIPAAPEFEGRAAAEPADASKA